MGTEEKNIFFLRPQKYGKKIFQKETVLLKKISPTYCTNPKIDIK